MKSWAYVSLKETRTGHKMHINR